MKRVLLVEDSRSERIKIQRFLMFDLGSSVCPIERVNQALTAVKTMLFDAAVIDFELPYGNGLEVAEALARDQPRCRVILCAADPLPAKDPARKRGWLVIDKAFLVRDLRAAFAHEMPTEPRG